MTDLTFVISVATLERHNLSRFVLLTAACRKTSNHTPLGMLWPLVPAQAELQACAHRFQTTHFGWVQ